MFLDSRSYTRRMDPLTHAVLGASVARVALAKPLGRAAWLPGVAGALLPDVDAFIRSGADPGGDAAR